MVGKESYDLNDMQSLLQDPNNIDLYDVYDKYNVEGVQVNIFKTYEIKLPFNVPQFKVSLIYYPVLQIWGQ